MPEFVNVIPKDIPLTETQVAALGKINWAHEVPHPDGGTQPQFGLKQITVEKPDGRELIRRDSQGRPERIFVANSPTLLKVGSWNSGLSSLQFVNLGIHGPISTYILSLEEIVEPIIPDRINEIGNFVVEVNRTQTQDLESRFVLEAQQRIVDMYQGYITSGIMESDDEFVRKLLEDASVSLKLVRDSREQIPGRVRGLVPKAQELGVVYIDERGDHSQRGVIFDPEAIDIVFTPDTDDLSLTDFTNHSREVLRWSKATDLERIAASLNSLLFALGLGHTSVLTAQLMFIPSALLVAVIGFIFLKEKLSKN